MKLTRILNQTKQTFFDCFNLKPSFKIDKSSLHSSYISLQKKYTFLKGSSTETFIALANSAIECLIKWVCSSDTSGIPKAI